MKRSLVIKFKDGTEKELPIVRATQIDVKKEMIHFDKREDGWLLVWTKSLIDEFKDVDCFVIKRED